MGGDLDGDCAPPLLSPSALIPPSPVLAVVVFAVVVVVVFAAAVFAVVVVRSGAALACTSSTSTVPSLYPAAKDLRREDEPGRDKRSENAEEKLRMCIHGVW